MKARDDDPAAAPILHLPAPARPKRRPRRAPVYVPGSLVPTAPPRKRLAAAADVWVDAVDIRTAMQEVFLVWDLDVRHRVLERRTVAIGMLTGVEVHPREVFRGALLNGAAAIIIAHNHPSGDPAPSRQDLELTSRLRQVGEMHGIPVLDHVVVVASGYISIAERGWM